MAKIFLFLMGLQIFFFSVNYNPYNEVTVYLVNRIWRKKGEMTAILEVQSFIKGLELKC